MAFTLNRRLSTLVDSSGQLKTGKIPNDYIDINHIADNSITTAMLHTGFTLPISSLTSIDTDDVTEGSTNLFYTTTRVDSHLSGGTGVTYSSGAISIGQAVATTDSPTFADLTITGNLNITGDINSYNVTDLDVTDQTITLGAGQIEANSGGSGIVIDGSNASILWDETNDQFDFNKGINVDSNTLVVDGTNNRVGILQASPAVSLDVGSATDAFFVPKGTTAQRPTGVDGYFRYNTDDAQFEGYADGAWGAIAGSGGGSAMETNNFTGDGSTTAFTLSSSVSNEDNLIVFIEGIYQNKGDYVASGTTITFDTAPVNGRRIVVQHILSSVAGNSTLYTSLTGDGSTTAFTLSGAPGHENNTQVFMDGVYQQKDSYIVNGTTLTFDAAPANNAEIEVMSFAQTTINQPGTNTVSVAELNLSDGTAGQFITTDGNGTISFASVPAGYTDSDVETYLNTSEIYTDPTNNRLGIGTSNPSSKLEVAGASGSSASFKLSGRPDWTSGSGQYNVGNIYGENLGAGVNTTRIKLDGDDVSGTMLFYTANSGTLTSAMYLDNTQNATFYGSTTIPLGDRYYGQIKARSDMYVTSYGGGAGNTNKGLLVSGGNTNENSWVFIDSANSTWGIYHRNTDSTETYSSDEPLRPNSIAWVGQGRLSGYFTLENKNGGVTTQASYVRGGLAGVYHEYKFKSDSGFEIGKGDDGEPVHTPTINERSSATNAVDSTVGNGGPGVYWLNFNSKRFRAYVRPNWLQGRNWVLAAKWFSATDMPSGSAYWSNDDYHNEGDFNPYSGLWSKYLSWRYFSFNRLAMQMGDRIAPIMQFSSSQTLYGAFSGGRANNGGGVSPTSTDPALSTGAIYHGMTNYMGPNFTDLGGLEDRMQSYGLNKWANSSTNSGSANNNGSADLNSNVSQGFQLTVEDAHKNIGGIPSQGVAGAWIGCPLDEGGFTFG